MRPVVRGPRPMDEDGNEIQYVNYQNARGELICRMGQFCSYCEMRLDTSLAVEHIQPKKPEGAVADIPEREQDWNNFLLACTNCNSTKGNTDVNLDDYFWPDRDNTFLAFTYSEGGIINPSEELSDELKEKARATIILTGLDKRPSNYSKASDRRLLNRRETWEIAQESKHDLLDCDTPQMRGQIVRSVAGYWSVWMTVFKDDPDMLRRFIKAFPGTAEGCFDGENGYAPVERPGGQI